MPCIGTRLPPNYRFAICSLFEHGLTTIRDNYTNLFAKFKKTSCKIEVVKSQIGHKEKKNDRKKEWRASNSLFLSSNCSYEKLCEQISPIKYKVRIQVIHTTYLAKSTDNHLGHQGAHLDVLANVQQMKDRINSWINIECCFIADKWSTMDYDGLH